MEQKKVGTGLIPPSVQKFMDWAAEDTEGFWGYAAEQAMSEVKWFKKWDKAFNWEYPTFQWFVGGQTNISYNCLDYNIEKGRAGRAAIIAESGKRVRSGPSLMLSCLIWLNNIPGRCAAWGLKKVIG